MMGQEELKKLLVGSKIVEVDLSNFGGSVQGLTLETLEGRLIRAESMSEPSWEGSTSGWIEITDTKTFEHLG
jgi:hypothetical protein